MNLSRNVLSLCLLFVLIMCAAPLRAHPLLTFKVISHTEPSKSIKKANDPPLKDTDDSYTMTVTLAPDYLQINKSNGSTIYDFTHARIYQLNAISHTYEDVSLYANIGFRVAEFHNRLYLAKMLATLKQKDNPIYPALTENLMSLVDESNHTAIDNHLVGADMVFSWNNQRLMTVSQKISSQPAATVSRYLRFLRYEVGGHPKILAVIGQGEGVPERVSVALTNVGTETRTLTLQSIEEQPDTSFTLNGYSPSLPDREPFKTLKRLSSHPSDDLDAHVDNIRHDRDVAFASGKVFDALLANFALQLSIGDGEQAAAWVAQHHDQINIDPDAQRLIKNLSPKDEASAKQAADVLAALGEAGGTYNYVLNIFEANIRSDLKQAVESERLFLTALAIEPTITGAWNDLASIYYSSFDPQAAWACWDAARNLRPTHPMLKGINDLEQKLRNSHSEFF